VYERGGWRTYPSGASGDPWRWDFTGREFWRVPVVPATAPILLFDARRDLDHLLYPHPWQYVRFRTDVVAGSGPERLALAALVEDFSPTADRHFALRSFLTAGQRSRLDSVPSGAALRITARTRAGEGSGRMEVSLVERDGTAWGTVIDLTGAWREIVVPWSRLRRTRLALLPRPYPLFLPYLFEAATTHAAPRPEALDGLQFAVSAALLGETGVAGSHGFEIERVVLDPGR
jgi:hypothetical protein